MDETINPCDNFYRFACGTWIKHAHIPEDSMFISFQNKKFSNLILAGVNDTFNELDAQLNANLIGMI